DAPIELGGEEPGAAHLAVAHHIDAGLLLVAQGEVDRIVEHLLEVDRPELAALGGGDPGDEPRRPRVRAHDARAQDPGHRSPPSSAAANANARAGFATNRHARIAASRPAASMAAVKPSS